ncbi:MAG: AMP-binding protein, partial [Clostridia bacterium]
RNLKELVIDKFEEYDEKIAFLEKNKITNKFESITYKKTKQDILSLGTVLYSELKLENKKIAVIGENSYKWFITYMATACGLGVIVPLDKELPKKEIINLIKRSDSKCIVYSSKKKELINEIKSELSIDIIYIEMNKSISDNESYSFNELLNKGYELINNKVNDYIDLKVKDNDLAILLFTSGTTNIPKGVMLSNNNIASNVSSAVDRFYNQTKLTFMSVLPMHHTYEFTVGYLCVLLSGGTVGICEGLRYISKNLKEIKPDCINCVPLIVENLKKKIIKGIEEQNKVSLIKNMISITNVLSISKNYIKRKTFSKIYSNFGGNLKYIMCGAAPLDKETIEFIEGIGIVVLQGYGLTETSPLISITPANNRVFGTVGIAMPGVDIRIDLKSDENIGEIMVKGSNVMLGYYEDLNETDKVIKKGWLYTGDLGYFDKGGNLVISSRLKNVIITSNGKNVYPEELENLINKIDLVKESMVYGKKESDGDIKLATKVTLDEEYIQDKYRDDRPTDTAIYNEIWSKIKEINKSVISYKIIKDLEIKKDDFEKTTTMKIKRFVELKK